MVTSTNVTSSQINRAAEKSDWLALKAKFIRVHFLINQYKKRLITIAIIAAVVFAWFNPYQFANLWLTKDQQGQILFQLGEHSLASQRFVDSRWKAYSLYGAEQYKQSATMYSQFETVQDKLAQANALAHGKNYVKAKHLYQNILASHPDFSPAKNNLDIVSEIIESINLMSESQRPEEGDSPKELGDEPQRADGAEKQEARKQEIEQLSAEQLLLNPELNEMWLRQVQKNPAQFLSIKFQMQLEQTKPVKKQEEE